MRFSIDLDMIDRETVSPVVEFMECVNAIHKARLGYMRKDYDLLHKNLVHRLENYVCERPEIERYVDALIDQVVQVPQSRTEYYNGYYLVADANVMQQAIQAAVELAKPTPIL